MIEAQQQALAVVKLSGKIISQPKLLKQVMAALSKWQSITRTQLVLVHGGGIYCDQWSEVWQLPVTKYRGLRVTPPEQLPVITGALAGYAHTQVLSAAKAAGLNPVGLTPSTASTLTCSLHPQHSTLGRIAQVSAGDPALVKRLLCQNFLPVFHSLAIADDGECLNANADDIASALCDCLHASELVLLSDVEGVLDASGQVIEKISPIELKQLADSPSISAGMIAKLEALAQMSWTSLQRVVITTGANPELLSARLSGKLPATEICLQSATA